MPSHEMYAFLTVHARGSRVWGERVVQVVQQHQRRVLRATQSIELIVPELAHFQEGVSRVKERRLDKLVGVGGVGNQRPEQLDTLVREVIEVVGDLHKTIITC